MLHYQGLLLSTLECSSLVFPLHSITKIYYFCQIFSKSSISFRVELEQKRSALLYLLCSLFAKLIADISVSPAREVFQSHQHANQKLKQIEIETNSIGTRDELWKTVYIESQRWLPCQRFVQRWKLVCFSFYVEALVKTSLLNCKEVHFDQNVYRFHSKFFVRK